MSETIIGIDPDSNGAVVIRHKGEEVTIESLRFVAPGEVELSWLSLFLDECREGLDRWGNPVRVYLERQRLVFIPFKGRGVSKSGVAIKASVTLAKIEYAIRGLLAGMNIPMESIPPGSWKRCFVHGKEPMLPVAARMFPSVVWTGNKLKKEGQATALMLAEWGRREREGRPK